MAMGGLRPVVAVYSTFLTRAIDQVMYDVGLHRQPVIFCLDRAGITGDDGPSHHGVLDMALLSKVPGMTIFAPSSYQELGQMLRDALDIVEGPVAIRWPKTNARNVPDDEVGHGLAARRVRSGSDVCLLSVGKMLDAVDTAAERLEASGVSVTLWDVRVVKPLDPRMIADAARHPLVITIEDGIRDGGAGAAMADAIASEALEDGRIGPPVRVLGTPCAYIPHGKPDAILQELGLDADGLTAETQRLLAALPPR
jgi:1-deoxy-D-xylulose-5-phosphate synthase